MGIIAYFKKRNALGKKEAGLNTREQSLSQREAALHTQEAELQAQEAALRSQEDEFQAREAALCTQETALQTRDAALQAQEAALQSRETELQNRESALNARDLELGDKEIQLGYQETALQTQASELQRREAQFAESEAKFPELVDAEVLRKLSDGSERAHLAMSDALVFSRFQAYEPVDDLRLFRAIHKPLRFAGPISIGAKIRSSEDRDKIYNVTLSSCTCPDFTNRRVPCKHMYRLAIQYGLLLQFDDTQQRKWLEAMDARQAELQKIRAENEYQQARLDEETEKRRKRAPLRAAALAACALVGLLLGVMTGRDLPAANRGGNDTAQSAVVYVTPSPEPASTPQPTRTPTQKQSSLSSGSTLAISSRSSVTNFGTATTDKGYIGNANTKKFHLPTCSYLPTEDNQVKFTTRAAAVAAGYDPCGHCDP